MTERAAALATLRRHPLENVVLLKVLHSVGEGVTIRRIARGDRAAVLLRIDHKGSAFDRQAYPDTAASILIGGDGPDLTLELLADLRPDERLVFKLSREADFGAVRATRPLLRRTAFHSFTAGDFHPADPRAAIETEGSAAPFHLFAEQGHAEDWLAARIERGKAFVSVARAEGEAQGACFAFEIDDAIWEIGGVFTRPAVRGRGFGQAVVRTALAELARRRLLPRYQVEEDNTASIRLAHSLGMVRHLTLTHYVSEA